MVRNLGAAEVPPPGKGRLYASSPHLGLDPASARMLCRFTFGLGRRVHQRAGASGGKAPTAKNARSATAKTSAAAKPVRRWRAGSSCRNGTAKPPATCSTRSAKPCRPTIPGSLSTRQYSDIVAYILSVNEFPAGEKELDRDVGRSERDSDRGEAMKTIDSWLAIL